MENLFEQIEIYFSLIQEVIDTEESEERKSQLIRFKKNKRFEYQQLKESLSDLLNELEEKIWLSEMMLKTNY